LDLIRLEFAVEREKIGVTMPILTSPPRPDKPKLLDQVRDVMRRKHYSIRTEQSYIDWIRRFILFHGKRHPAQMAEAEVTAFLTHLARDGGVAASTQNQALSALLFLYKEVLKQELGWLENVERAKKPARLPVVLTRRKCEKFFSPCTALRASWPDFCMAAVCA
jgi:site-specific recombinase XerD